MNFIEYGKQQILGDDARAEKVYEWSLKHAVGTSFTKSLKCGLGLRIVADGEEPKLYILWNQNTFNQFVEASGGPDCLLLQHWGLEIIREGAKTTITVLDESDLGHLLYDHVEGDTQTSEIIGMIRLSTEGPYLHTEEECSLTPASVKATAEAVLEEPPTIQSKFSKKTDMGAVASSLINIIQENSNRKEQ